MLFTLDLDFADLRKFPPDRILESFCSDLAAWDRWLLTNFYLKFAQQTELSDLARCFAIVEPHRVRVRRPSIFDEPGDWEEISLENDK